MRFHQAFVYMRLYNLRLLLIYVLISGFILLLLLLILTIWLPVNDSDCSLRNFIIPKKQEFLVHASKVVVEPWLGQHHVYAIFTIPDVYRETPFFIVTVPGDRQYCSHPFGYDQNYDDVFAPAGTHLVRYYIRTRTGIKLIFQGLYSQLNNPEKWLLRLPKSKEQGTGNGEQ